MFWWENDLEIRWVNLKVFHSKDKNRLKLEIARRRSLIGLNLYNRKNVYPFEGIKISLKRRSKKSSMRLCCFHLVSRLALCDNKAYAKNLLINLPTTAGSSWTLNTLLTTSCKSVLPTMSENLIFRSWVWRYLAMREKIVSLPGSGKERSSLSLLTRLMLSFWTISSPGSSFTVSPLVTTCVKALVRKFTPRHAIGFSLFVQSTNSLALAHEIITMTPSISRSRPVLPCIFISFSRSARTITRTWDANGSTSTDFHHKKCSWIYIVDVCSKIKAPTKKKSFW